MRIVTLALLLLMIASPTATVFSSAPPQDIPAEVDAAVVPCKVPATTSNTPAENGADTAWPP